MNLVEIFGTFYSGVVYCYNKQYTVNMFKKIELIGKSDLDTLEQNV